MSQDEAGVSRRDFLAASAAVMAAGAVGGCQKGEGGVMAVAPGATVKQHAVFEVALRSERKVANAFWDLLAAGDFVSPSGRRYRAEGFYDGDNVWRVRFAPSEQGVWQYKAALTVAGTNEREGQVAGTFRCEGVQGHGFLRISKKNQFRMEHEDGTAFYPIGVQTCNFLQPDFDGPLADGKGRFVPHQEWLEAFKGAVNLVRTQLGQGTTAGCALPLIPVGAKDCDFYDVELAKKIDEALVLQREAGIAQILIFFQDMSLWANPGQLSVFGDMMGPNSFKRLGASTLPLQEKYIRYVVARWGSMIDIWEIFNEDSHASSEYLAHLAKVIRAADPYQRLITTNYSHPSESWCEIVTFHEYMGMPANEVDLYLASQFAIFKSYGKPVQNTEFGNQRRMPNVDPVKWRIAVWTAFMYECGLLFWSMSQKRYEQRDMVIKSNANAYLGADSRQHFRVLAEFTKDLPIDLKPTAVGYTTHKDIRLYGMSNGSTAVLYVHHFADHTTEYTRTSPLFIWTGPGRFRMTWVNPEDGAVVKVEECENPQQYLNFMLPPVKVDLACRVERVGDAA